MSFVDGDVFTSQSMTPWTGDARDSPEFSIHVLGYGVNGEFYILPPVKTRVGAIDVIPDYDAIFMDKEIFATLKTLDKPILALPFEGFDFS